MDNPLLKKLQLKPQFKVAVYHAPENFKTIIGEIPPDFHFVFEETTDYDALLLFATTKAELRNALDREAVKLNQNKICWVIYPKAKTKLANDLNLMQSWDDLKTYQLIPCASAAVDAIWTAIRIKPVGEQKKSGLGNAEIEQGSLSEFIDVKNKTVKLPEFLQTELKATPDALANYEKLAYSHKKEYVLWVLSAKQEKTKAERIQKMIDKLLAGKKNPSEK